MTEPNSERRRFSRIPFDSTAHLKSESDLYLNCHVHDISLNGILVDRPINWHGKLNDAYQIDLLLENGNIVIVMQASVAHINPDQLGFECHHIDVDSISHLKRLVELNLGDEAILQRELSALIDAHQLPNS